MRDICALVIPAIEHVTAKLQTGILTEDFAFERHQLQPADIHEVIVVVNAGVASVPVEDAGVISQQIFLLGPDVCERLAPDLHTDLPLRRESPSRQTAFDYDQGRVWSNLFQAKRCFPLADLDVRFRELMPVDEDVCGLKSGAA